MAGRRALVRCVLSAMPTFTLTVLRVPMKILREIDKCKRRFLWCQYEEITGASSKVNWPTVCALTEHGGLGIPDLQRFGRALRLRWLWISWQQPARPWTAFPLPCDKADRELFARPTAITIGDGQRTGFWTCPWLDGTPLIVAFPSLFKHSRRKNRSVAAALDNDQWIRDVRHESWENIVTDVVSLARLIRDQGQALAEHLQDKIRWTASGNGIYSTSAAYKTQFTGTPPTHTKNTI